MIAQEFVETFARDWVEAWNSHDLERILDHYEDDFEMSSPIIAQLAGEASGMLRGKTAVGTYWTKALAAIPDLHFEIAQVLAGANSVTISYKGHRGLAAEVFHFGAGGKVSHAYAYYALGNA